MDGRLSAEEKDEAENVFMASQVTRDASQQTWYIDSGCTSHIAKEESMFSKLDKSVNTKVKLGNGQVVQAQGKGSVVVQTKEGMKLIHNVLFIPCLAQNLLSVAQMISNGYSLTFKGQHCCIYDKDGHLICKVTMVDKSFPLSWQSVYDSVNYAKIDDPFLQNGEQQASEYSAGSKSEIVQGGR